MKGFKLALPLVLGMSLAAGSAMAADGKKTPGSPCPAASNAPCPGQQSNPCPAAPNGPCADQQGAPCIKAPAPQGICPGQDAGFRLSAESSARYEKIVKEYIEPMRKLKDELFVKKAQLKALENATDPDMKAVTETASAVVILRNKLSALHSEMEQRIMKEVIEPERKAAAAQAASKPAEQKAPAEAAAKPAEQKAPAEAANKPAEQKAPAEAANKPAEQKAPAEAANKPAEQKAPAEAANKPAEQKAPAEAAAKPAEQKAPAEAANKPDPRKKMAKEEKPQRRTFLGISF